jgi:hypothetical protein
VEEENVIVQDTQWMTRRMIARDNLLAELDRIDMVHEASIEGRCNPECVKLSGVRVDERNGEVFFCTFWWYAKTTPWGSHLRRTNFGQLLEPDEVSGDRPAF